MIRPEIKVIKMEPVSALASSEVVDAPFHIEGLSSSSTKVSLNSAGWQNMY